MPRRLSARAPAPESDRSGAIQKLAPIALLILTALISGYVFIAPGDPINVDIWPHLVRTRIVYQWLHDGISPFYSFMFYSGYPHLRFYSPLFYFLAGTLSVATGGDALSAARVLLLMLHLLSGWTMFSCLRHRTRDSFAAALGAIVYLLIPWRSRYIATIGNYPLGLLYVLLPLLFRSLDRIIERTARATEATANAVALRKEELLLGLWLALAILSHVIYAGFTIIFLAVVFVPAIMRGGSAIPRKRWLAPLMLAAVFAVAVSAFFLVPFLLEYRSHAFPQPFIALPAPDLKMLVNRSAPGGGYTGGYLGISTLMLLLLGIGSWFARRTPERKTQTPIVIGLAIALLLTFAVPSLGRLGAFLTAGLPYERFLFYVTFFAALLIPSAYSWLKTKLAGRRMIPAVIFYVLALVIAADCLPVALRFVYFRKSQYLGVREEIYSMVSTQKPTRVLDLSEPTDQIDAGPRLLGYPAMNFLYGGLATPLGPPYGQFAPQQMLYAYPWINQIASDLADSTTRVLNPRSIKAFALLGISHLILQPKVLTLTEVRGERYQVLLTKAGVNWNDRPLKTQRLPRVDFASIPASLVLASNVIRSLSAEKVIPQAGLCIADDWQTLLDTVSIATDANRISFIPVKAGQSAESLPGLPAVTVRDWSIRNDRVELSFSASSECFLRLAVSYYPELKVALDRKAVPVSETKDHFIYLRCPAGDHKLQITAPLTPLRVATLAVSAVAVLFTLLALFVLAKRPRRFDPNPPAA